MIHAFLLFVFIGVGDDKVLKSNDLYFRSVDDCIYFSKRLHGQSNGNGITAYCLPVQVDPKKVKVY